MTYYLIVPDGNPHTGSWIMDAGQALEVAAGLSKITGRTVRVLSVSDEPAVRTLASYAPEKIHL